MANHGYGCLWLWRLLPMTNWNLTKNYCYLFQNALRNMRAKIAGEIMRAPPKCNHFEITHNHSLCFSLVTQMPCSFWRYMIHV